MSEFVVDASVVLTWCFPDENSPYAEKIAERLGRGDRAVVPAFWAHEVVNALLTGEKRKRISRALVKSFLADLETLPFEVRNAPNGDVFSRVQELSVKHGLTAYDAAYLHLAEITGLPLATLDIDLTRAREDSGIPSA